jgi:hypothetical protein
VVVAAPSSVPEWLARRSGAIQRGVDRETRFVLVGGEPLYKLEVRPAVGRFTCAVTETANGRRLDDGGAIHGTFDEALAGGLERLKERLGW